MSAAASLGAVALVAWVALQPPTPTLVATTPAPASIPIKSAETPALASVSSDGRMNEYLLAHQGFSPSTAIQGLAPYIRSVSTTPQVEGR
jgi:sigma-E factor negative regulatory protein RseA